MALRKFFVNNGHASVGPFEMSAIVEKVHNGELKATDSICVNVDNDEWILICQHEEFLKNFKAAKPAGKVESKTTEAPHILVPEMKVIPSAPPVISDHHDRGVDIENAQTATAIRQQPIPETSVPFSGDFTNGQWYVLKGKNRFGPFMYLDLVRMLQEKSIFEFDYIWTQGLEKWKRIAELECFSAEHVRALFGDGHDEVFYRRSFPRARYETTLICHDNSNVWKGRTVEISEGGAGVVIKNALLLPGQNVYMHFKPGSLSKSFNCLCEVVSKRFMKGLRDSEAPVLYGVKFINIQKIDREAIRNINSAA